MWLGVCVCVGGGGSELCVWGSEVGGGGSEVCVGHLYVLVCF